MRKSFERLMLAAALLLCGAGLLSGILVSVRLYQSHAEIQRRKGLLGRLSVLESRLSEIDRAKTALDLEESKPPADLEEFLRIAGLSEKVTDSNTSLQSLDDGWSVITRQLSLSDVVMADLDSFIIECHRAKPAWVLSEISLRSSPFESGRAQAALSLQALRGKAK